MQSRNNLGRSGKKMTRRLIRYWALSALVLGLAVVSTKAQNFQKSYQIPAGGQVKIGNISGDVSVKGYNGDAVIVRATKKGPDADLVEIEDRSTQGRVDVTVKYPQHQDHMDASVDFDVQVPRSTPLNFDHIASVSGDVSINDVSGKVHASSVSGDIHVGHATGSVTASSVSGDVNVDISGLEGMDDMKFSAVSGDVKVTLPANLDADVDISTLSGDIDTNFPLEIKKEKYAPGRTARGRLGDGARHLKMSTVSGSVTLKHS